MHFVYVSLFAEGSSFRSRGRGIISQEKSKSTFLLNFTTLFFFTFRFLSLFQATQCPFLLLQLFLYSSLNTEQCLVFFFLYQTQHNGHFILFFLYQTQHNVHFIICFLHRTQRNVHPKVGLVTKEEFETRRGGEEGGREGEEGDGEMVFPLDLQEGGGGGGGGDEEGNVEGEAALKKAALPSPVAEKKGK